MGSAVFFVKLPVLRPGSPLRSRLGYGNRWGLSNGWLLRLRYARSMTEVASRDLRNNTAGLLRRVGAGEDITVTVKGKPVARLVPLQPSRRRWLSRDELLLRLRRAEADPGLRQDLATPAGDAR